jgi:hypothetical protein
VVGEGAAPHVKKWTAAANSNGPIGGESTQIVDHTEILDVPLGSKGPFNSQGKSAEGVFGDLFKGYKLRIQWAELHILTYATRIAYDIP